MDCSLDVCVTVSGILSDARQTRSPVTGSMPRPGLCTSGDADDVDELVDEENYSQEWVG